MIGIVIDLEVNWFLTFMISFLLIYWVAYLFANAVNNLWMTSKRIFYTVRYRYLKWKK